MATKRTRRRASRPRKAVVRRKNVNIDQAKLDRVRDLLGAETETQAIDQALALVLLREEVLEGIDRIAGTGGVENYFEGD